MPRKIGTVKDLLSLFSGVIRGTPLLNYWPCVWVAAGKGFRLGVGDLQASAVGVGALTPFALARNSGDAYTLLNYHPPLRCDAMW